MKGKAEHRDQGYELHPDRIVLKTPVVTINAGPVICRRSGREKEFYRFDFPDWVNVVAVTPDNHLVMIRQFRYGTGKAEMEIPGGMMNVGEDPVTAGCRELLEETGYAGKDGIVIGKVCPNPAIQHNFCHTVLVREAIKVADPALDEMEDIECLLFPEKDVLQMVDQGLIDHGLVLNALMFYRGLR